ncbi:MAG: aldo/keto reductase [Thermoleophilia bacterium]
MPFTQRRPLGASGLSVAPLCLGANVFGWSADEERSHQVLDEYVALGGNFIDTANIYSAWVPGNEGGESEEIIGSWLAGRSDRDQLVIATKVGMAGGAFPKGLGRDAIRRGVEGSLGRLGIDRIDLFYAHEDDLEAPLTETAAAFGELVDEGLVTAVGASNFTAPRLRDALRAADEVGAPRYCALQPHFNLLDRAAFDAETQAVCAEFGLAVAPYYALARGFLAGKYRPDAPLPTSPRAPGVQRDYFNDRGWRVLATVEDIASAHGVTAAQVSLAWLIAHPGVTAPIASATTQEQVRELAGAAEVRLTEQDLARLEQAGA